MEDKAQQPLPHRRVVEVPVVDSSVAAYHRMESNAAVAAAATDSAAQQPRKKKQKVRRKPPPAETIARLPEESKLQTPMNATSLHGSEFLSETRLTHWTEAAAAAPRQRQFIFSPRQPLGNAMIVPGEMRLPAAMGDNIMHRLRPIEHDETSVFSAGRRHTSEADSVTELVASLPMGSFPFNLAAMSASSPRRLEEIHYRSHLGPEVASTQSHILPNSQHTRAGFVTSDAVQSLALGSVPSNTHSFGAQPINSTHLALAASQSMRLTNISSHSIGLGTTPLSFPLPRTSNQNLEGMLRQQQQVPQTQNPVMGALVAVGNVERATTTEEQRLSVPRTTPTTALQLPAIMGHSSDILQMNDHQVYLRQQIEVFQATQEDLYANTRGRNKRIHVGQVGIRCRHCAHIPPRQRQTGTVYFPATMRGLYQAAQNMSTNHIQCGLCTEMPDDVKAKFVELWPTKNRVSRAGARYWEEAAQRLGLVDTDNGIAFQPNPPGP